MKKYEIKEKIRGLERESDLLKEKINELYSRINRMSELVKEEIESLTNLYFKLYKRKGYDFARRIAEKEAKEDYLKKRKKILEEIEKLTDERAKILEEINSLYNELYKIEKIEDEERRKREHISEEELRKIYERLEEVKNNTQKFIEDLYYESMGL